MRPARNPVKTSAKRAAKPAASRVPPTAAGMEVVQATAAKNRFGAILKRARAGAGVVISRRGKPEFVVMAYPRYHSLVHQNRDADERQLDELRADFDALYAQMQTAQSRRGIDRLLDMSADEMNEIAARRTRTRG